ncbi:lanthionine synthetase LanC family protein [Massilia sp. Root335]|uniref:lanthionine synthetase LanC family protein n=1 Tax=Massilia sp. Root335 TaxID=1736517 RepID=UPI0007132A98|nr:lanthionine synthetase LanC family protein [Massilia sp. Root335]KQV30515.1 hypothetical protein ASC93_03430 [Massilia sp. Root335]
MMPTIDNDIARLELLVQARAPSLAPNLGLASGVAGVVLMQARLYQLRPTAARRECIARLVADLVAHLPRQHLAPGLWTGLAGILYAFEFVRRVDPALLGDDGDDIAGFVLDMDAVLCQFMRNAPGDANYDLISGISGLGAYALMRTDRTAAQAIFQAAEHALGTAAERGHDSWTWKTAGKHIPGNGSGQQQPQQQQRDGRYDLGVAHGVAGVIGLLSLGLRVGLGSPDTGTMLRYAIDWLLAQENPPAAHSRFPSTLTAPAGSSRLGWCYGDLGIAMVLAAAAQALDDLRLDTYWQTLLEARLRQPDSSFVLDSPGLCHGKSGVVHLLAGLARRADLPAATALTARLRAELAHAPKEGDDGRGAGLLEGWAGVALALAEPDESTPLSARPWDLCLLAGG